MTSITTLNSSSASSNTATVIFQICLPLSDNFLHQKMQTTVIATNANNITSLDGRVTALEQAGSGATVVSGTLTAGQTSLTLSNAAITAASFIDVYTDGGVPFTSIVQNVGSVVISFEEQAANLNVSIVVRDFS
jgi:hypothetical protein